jgi:L-threonylcarbamoyladenylate synthase
MASDFAIRHAAHIIKNGGIIAYPTDTIYGLGCDPYNVEAVERLNVIKQRPLNKQFILLAGHVDQVKDLVQINQNEQKKISENATPTSWVINASENTPDWLTDSNHTLTIRISNNDTVKKLCDVLGHAIVSTSANLSGKRPAENTFRLHQYFHQKVDMILTANRPQTGRPSKIIRLCDNHIFRQ